MVLTQTLNTEHKAAVFATADGIITLDRLGGFSLTVFGRKFTLQQGPGPGSRHIGGVAPTRTSGHPGCLRIDRLGPRQQAGREQIPTDAIRIGGRLGAANGGGSTI